MAEWRVSVNKKKVQAVIEAVLFAMGDSVEM